MLKNAGKVWSAQLVTPASAASSCDASVAVQAGDNLEFIVHNTSSANLPGPGLEVSGNKDGVQLNGRDGKPLKIGAKAFTQGLAFRSAGKVIVHLPAPALRFAATIGLDAGADPKASADYSVAAGNKTLFKPDLSQRKPDGMELWQDLNGATEVTLTAGSGMDWANAKMIQVDGKEIWLADLPVQGPRNKTSRILWDPVITYVK